MAGQVWNGNVRLFGSVEELQAGWGDGRYVAGSPEVRALEEKLTERYGMPTVVTNRGMTAILSVVGFQRREKRVVAVSCYIYPGTEIQLGELDCSGLGLFDINWFDPTDLTDFETELDDGAEVAFVETIGNYRAMPVADVEAMLKLASQYYCLLVVDATLTPQARFEPHPNLVVVSSLTKYDQPDDEWLGGRISAMPETIDEIRATRFFTDAAMSRRAAACFSDWVGRAGEMAKQHSRHALELADMCQSHKAVKQVWYPGLSEHPQHDLLQSRYGGLGGGLLYLQLRGGVEAAAGLADNLVVRRSNDWHIASSFGSRDWRVLPGVGPLEKKTSYKGGVRIAPGRINPEQNIEAFRQALDGVGDVG